MKIEYAPIPIWGIITSGIIFLVPIVWAIIKMFFRVDLHNSRIKNTEDNIKLIETNMLKMKGDIEDKIDRHKIETNVRLTEINNTGIATKTLVELLVNNKIKKEED